MRSPPSRKPHATSTTPTPAGAQTGQEPVAAAVSFGADTAAPLLLTDDGHEEIARPTRGLSVWQRRLLQGLAVQGSVQRALAADGVLQRRPIEADLDRLMDLGLVVSTRTTAARNPASGSPAPARAEAGTAVRPARATHTRGLLAGAGAAILAGAAVAAYVNTRSIPAPEHDAQPGANLISKPLAATPERPPVAVATVAEMPAAAAVQGKAATAAAMAPALKADSKVKTAPAASVAPLANAQPALPAPLPSPRNDVANRADEHPAGAIAEKPDSGSPRGGSASPPLIAPPAPAAAQPSNVQPTTTIAMVPETKPAARQSAKAVIDPQTACTMPSYPAAALRAQQTGVVLLNFLIDVDGSVIETKIERSSGYRVLDDAARRDLSQCKFIPAKVDGRPVQSWARLEYEWRLE
jgi:protein TonB